MEIQYKYDIKELRNHKVNSFTILEEGVKIKEGNKNRRTFLCRCECGREKEVQVKLLMNGNTMSCGKCRNTDSKIGLKNGHLEILEELPKKYTNRMFSVRCNNCDSIKKYSTAVFNKRTHCGCLNNLLLPEIQPLELPKVRGVYTLFEEIDSYRNHNNEIVRKVEAECNKCGHRLELTYNNISTKNKGCIKCAAKIAGKEKRDSNPNWEIYNELRSRYNNMKARCYNPDSKDYKNYGARGITICSEWLEPKVGYSNFVEWSVKNGYEKNLEIDRRDNEKGYSIENCRWVSREINCRNTRQTKLTEEIVRSIRYGEYKNFNNLELSQILEVTPSTIEAVKNKKTWKEI